MVRKIITFWNENKRDDVRYDMSNTDPNGNIIGSPMPGIKDVSL